MAIFFTILLTAFFTAIFTAIFTYKKARHILIEKWMNQIRDEVSKYLGLCEKLRLINKVNLSDSIYSELMTSMFKIELLLRREKDQANDNQAELLERVIRLRELAQSHNFKNYNILEREIVEYTYYILRDHWKEINSELKNYPLNMLKKWFCKSA